MNLEHLPLLLWLVIFTFVMACFAWLLFEKNKGAQSDFEDLAAADDDPELTAQALSYLPEGTQRLTGEITADHIAAK